MKSFADIIRLPLLEDNSLLRDGIAFIIKSLRDKKIVSGFRTSGNIITEIQNLKTYVIITGPAACKYNVFSETVPITNK
ncbi:MAG: hypothetical protein MUE56_10185 [Ignavibacteria bacterium]|jgi:hypothetical protein|nr:hypothetical protein [Ignavibacteria bacterium]